MTTKEPMTAESLTKKIRDELAEKSKHLDGYNWDILGESVLREIKQHTVDLQSQNDDLTQQVSTLLADRAAEHSHLHVLASILAGDKEVNLIEMVELTRELQAEVERLKGFCKDLQWMAKRYAEGRQTFAPSTVNEITRSLMAMGVELNLGAEGTPWARDGGGRKYSDLTDAEWSQGEPLSAWAKIAYGEDFDQLRQENERLAMELSVAQRDVLGLRDKAGKYASLWAAVHKWYVDGLTIVHESAETELADHYFSRYPMLQGLHRQMAVQKDADEYRNTVIEECIAALKKDPTYTAEAESDFEHGMDAGWEDSIQFLKALKTNGGKG